MIFRQAHTDDIPQIQAIRRAVKENVLSDPGLVTDSDCAEYLEMRGRGWVCETQDKIVGFAIADLQGNNIWALFVQPEYENQGIGKKLHEIMLEWYFSRTKKKIWLGTSPETRAENFYRRAGWKEIGLHGKSEIKFEMEYSIWISLH